VTLATVIQPNFAHLFGKLFVLWLKTLKLFVKEKEKVYRISSNSNNRKLELLLIVAKKNVSKRVLMFVDREEDEASVEQASLEERGLFTS